MYWIHLIIASILLQSMLINRIDAGLIRRRRQQTSASLYGNSNPGGANPSAGYNYPVNTNLYGTNLNNQASKDLYGNPIVPSNTGNSLSMGLNNQQQQQQQHQQQQHQLYGANSQSLANPSFTGTGLYSPTGVNQGTGNLPMRDANGNLLPAGSSGSSLYSPTNSQLSYSANANQGLYNKDAYNPALNTNNNQYGLNNNLYPNSNTYTGQQIPNTNNNQWQTNNNNNNNQYPLNAGNTWSQNRDSNTNNNAYNNPNSPYFYNSGSHQMMTSCLMIFLSFLIRMCFHI